MIHYVEQGDCCHTIAAKYGFDSWRAIYLHDDNTALRALRPSADLLYPGDEVHIPELEEKTVPRPTESRHTFSLGRPHVKLHVFLHGDDRKPIAGARYIVRAPSFERKGRTDGDGLVDQRIPASLASVDLLLWLDDTSTEPDIEYTLLLGHLDPIDTFTGVRERLRNLGYRCNMAEPGSAAIRAAVRAFRRDHGLSVDEGDPAADDANADASDDDALVDATFRDRLRLVHDRG